MPRFSLMSRTAVAGASAIILSMAAPIAFAFTDVQGQYDYAAAIEALKEKGVITGYADGSFKPKAPINRAEFLAILLRSRNADQMKGGNCFPDVKDQWFASLVCTAKAEGVVAGYPDGTFKPDQFISFVEAGKMLSLAYKQQVSQDGGEWYEQYARALDGSKAIPMSIASLDAKVNRGEMAEMMWRLSEGHTDKPSKGYLNVKYPTMKTNLASDNPQKIASCTDLKAFTEEAQQSAQLGGGMVRRGMMMEDAVAAPMAAMGSAEKSQNAPTDYSHTNVQVSGVDEGDRIKTDGNYLYILGKDNAVRIVKASPVSSPTVAAVITPDQFSPTELYIDGDTLAVVGNMNMSYPPVPMPLMRGTSKMMAPSFWMQKTAVVLYDVSDRNHPKQVRTVSFEGNAVSSRLIDGKLSVVLSSSPRWFGGAATTDSTAKSLVPVFDDSALSLKDEPVAKCTDIVVLPRVPRPQYLVVATVPLASRSASVQRTAILGDAQNIYASTKNLYVSSTEWKYDWSASQGTSEEKTNVYRFAFANGGTTFEAQGSVPGHILNQFSMDENGDTFRIATTKSESQTWQPGIMEDTANGAVPPTTRESVSTNNLYVLGSDLKTLGSIEDIAPTESIYSVRFMGDRAYMVTFQQIDPLFVIDLSDARHPTILGKLKIPGYSNYLHPVDATHILGFGKDVDASIDADKVHTPGAVYYTAVLGMKIALFDVSDVANPREISKEVIGAQGTDSPLLTDHKALLFDMERGLLAFPVTVYEKRAGSKPTDYASDTVPVFQGAYVYDFSVKTGMKLRGKITHHADGDFSKSGDYWYDMLGMDIERIIRIGESLFTVSSSELETHDISGLQKQGSVKLAPQGSSASGRNGGIMPIELE